MHTLINSILPELYLTRGKSVVFHKLFIEVFVFDFLVKIFLSEVITWKPLCHLGTPIDDVRGKLQPSFLVESMTIALNTHC